MSPLPSLKFWLKELVSQVILLWFHQRLKTRVGLWVRTSTCYQSNSMAHLVWVLCQASSEWNCTWHWGNVRIYQFLAFSPILEGESHPLFKPSEFSFNFLALFRINMIWPLLSSYHSCLCPHCHSHGTPILWKSHGYRATWIETWAQLGKTELLIWAKRKNH